MFYNVCVHQWFGPVLTDGERELLTVVSASGFTVEAQSSQGGLLYLSICLTKFYFCK